MNDDEGTGVRRGAQGIIDKASGEHLVGGQQVRHLPDILAGGSVHATTTNAEPCRVGENCRLHG